MALTANQQQVFNTFPAGIRIQYHQQIRELGSIANQVTIDEPQSKATFDDLIHEVEMSLFESIVLFNLKDTCKDMTHMLLGPVFAQGAIEYSTQKLCNDQELEFCSSYPMLPIALGVAALTAASYINVGQYLFGMGKKDFTKTTVSDVREKIKKHLGASSITAHHKNKLILILYYVLLKTERGFLQKIISFEDRIMQNTQSYFAFGSIMAGTWLFTRTSVIHRMLLSCTTGISSLWQRQGDCGQAIMELFRFCEEDEHRFHTGVRGFVALCLRKDLDAKTRSYFNLIPERVMKPICKYIEPLASEYQLNNLIGRDDIDQEKMVRLDLQPKPRLPSQISSDCDNKKISKSAVSVAAIAVLPQAAPTEAKVQLEPELEKFKQRIKQQINAYSGVNNVAAGWQRWLENQKFALGACSELLGRVEKKEIVAAEELREVGELLQQIILYSEKETLQHTDWKLTNVDKVKSVTQSHFDLMIDLVQYFVKKKCVHIADWLSGFYPYLPAMIKERLIVSELATQLLKKNIHLREIGTSIYWPTKSEDIDIIIWSETQPYGEIVQQLNFLMRHGWFAESCIKDDKKGYATHCFQKSGFKKFDVVIYTNFNHSLLKENIEARAVNIASAVANVTFSWVYLLPENAQQFQRGIIDCTADAIVNSNNWFIVTKTLWKMEYANQLEMKKNNQGNVAQYKSGANLITYRELLYDLESDITLFHLIHLVNKSIAYDRVMGLWNMLVSILNDARIQLIKPSLKIPLDEAKNKVGCLLLNEHNDVKGWLLLLLSTLDCEPEFFEQAKLGLTTNQQIMLRMLHGYCLQLKKNPYSSPPKPTCLQKLSKRLISLCQEYWKDTVSPEKMAAWKVYTSMCKLNKSNNS